MTTAETLLRLGGGVGLGTVIGFERQYRAGWPGCGPPHWSPPGRPCPFCCPRTDSPVRAPTRRGWQAQIVPGIGFLGAGVILREGLTVRRSAVSRLSMEPSVTSVRWATELSDSDGEN